ncbi:MAG: hypothetical protein A3D37_02410 [Candidatus Zambryskibacteria bacterium RIFCSPHIGHO2_02_FULL_38_22]|uniref:tRNA-dihydrouridine synthase n=1 Tax=Candidatus Zambryskibacteria bacterium RIFCSPLOWO2_12_FULL_39_16 TaxID=1802775 RepID=A0A1G2UU19_9BACT|nr:MAG: hypothetical protein A3D37_02410 [Candidatus Zambryskibacteria bacterium RIFCSPHIGHO2_02_FULL_38_22]OHB08736.1 MAG: hypothetical protein A3I19_02005 [Candidatus Zambryskibacteria bacterium RIFCSPLOWO2_02_FULL_38_13]OHB12899.1 MAG: hypothetical protein A3G46_02690 [Candidatus Zambryskibacteria bacterium RIFCSPLOWO2_12_FULL_39_16]
MSNFWNEMKKPILCLAPMADVTDAAFRHIIAKYSKNSHSYVTYTEFVSADGLVLAPEKGRKKLLKGLEYSEIERPIVAQFFTSRPEIMEKVAELAVMLGFDGIDINMGCPDKSIEKQGAGAALIKNLPLARELIKAAKKGVAEAAKRLNKEEIPVSVKTRLGYNKDELETWLLLLLAENPAAIIIHARTREEMSKVPAKWERIKRAVEIRDEIQPSSSPKDQKCTDIFLLENSSCSAQSASQGIFDSFSSKTRTLIIGNGDVADTDDAIKKCQETGADGAMLGRAIFGNPFLFSEQTPTNEEKIKVLLEHTKLFEEKFRGIKSFAVMKKHFKEYLKDLSARDLRFKLMRAENAEEVEEMIKDYLPTLLSVK